MAGEWRWQKELGNAGAGIANPMVHSSEEVSFGPQRISKCRAYCDGFLFDVTKEIRSKGIAE